MSRYRQTTKNALKKLKRNPVERLARIVELKRDIKLRRGELKTFQNLSDIRAAEARHARWNLVHASDELSDLCNELDELTNHREVQ